MPFARPRVRSQITEDPRYYELRNEALDFLYNRFAHSKNANKDAPEQPAQKISWVKLLLLLVA
jgi:nitrate/nitrite transport system ATP-binding protein